ncbi:NACHT domain-containing protein [Nocardia wallacei]|uniref:NACHT domain-containing protein n=1 Tax=Nocardia wallacei TaxID=480035 RepID=UPI0024573CF1|nr:NACHT domain-containing protein [Nocardia wallacei]
MSNENRTRPAFPWAALGWAAAAVGLPVAVAAAAKEFAVEHPPVALLLLAAYWFVLAAARFTGGVASDVADRWRPRLVERVDGVLIARLSRYGHGYRRWLLNHLRKIDLQGLVTTPNSVPAFDQIYIDVSLVNRPRHQVSTDPLSDRVPAANAERLSISTLLKSPDARVLAVLGAPGSGKTTLLRQAARQACRRRFGRRRVPILLSLREHATAIAEDPALRLPARAVPTGLDRPPPAGWFESRLRRGRCVVLLDGLDEVGQPALRETLVKWVDEQIGAYPKNHYVLTSRRHGYPAAAINSADVLQVRQLSAEQIAQFIDNWYATVEPDRTHATQQARHLREQIKTHTTLDAMSVNPLLLTMIVNVHRERGVLPRNRVELYREICEVLLWRRRAVKGLTSTVQGTDKLAVLQILALTMMAERVRDVSTSRAVAIIRPAVQRLDGVIDPLAMLTELRNDGILVEPETGAIGFCHKTFQEYLASVEIQARNQVDLLVANIDDDWWRETTILYTAQYDADIIIHACLASQTPAALELAFDCTEQGTRMAPSLRAQMSDLLGEVGNACTTPMRRHLLTRVVLRRFLRHTVEVGTEHRGTHPVPASLYRLFMADEADQGRDRTPDTPLPQLDTAPVTGVRYDDATAFVAWVNHYEPAASYRLPHVSEAADLAAHSPLADSPPPMWLSPTHPPAGGPGRPPHIRWTPTGPDHPYRISADIVGHYLSRDIYLATALILDPYDPSSEPLRGRRAAASLYTATYYQDLHTDQGRLHNAMFVGPLDPALARALVLAYAHDLGRALARLHDSLGRRRPTRLTDALHDLTDHMGIRIEPDLTADTLDLTSAAEIGDWFADFHPHPGYHLRDLLILAGQRDKPLTHATTSLRRLAGQPNPPLHQRTVTALTQTPGDMTRDLTFTHAPLPWIRDLGDQLAAFVTAALERRTDMPPAVATLFRLTALSLALESDYHHGPRHIRTACQTIVNATTILERRLHGPIPPNEIIVLTRE